MPSCSLLTLQSSNTHGRGCIRLLPSLSLYCKNTYGIEKQLILIHFFVKLINNDLRHEERLFMHLYRGATMTMFMSTAQVT